MKRINKIAIELNVSVNTLIQELKKVSEKQFDKNSKLDLKEIEFLTEIFQKDKKLKIEADKKKSTFYFDIDENFSFNEQEKRAFSELISDYEKKQKDIKELKGKENRFWALEEEEIKSLLKSKFQKIYEIQKEIKENREFKTITNSYKSERDPYENFRFGGLSGEEAHTAYWNCD